MTAARGTAARGTAARGCFQDFAFVPRTSRMPVSTSNVNIYLRPSTFIAGSSPGHELAKKLIESIKGKKAMAEKVEMANSILSQVSEDVEMDENQGMHKERRNKHNCYLKNRHKRKPHRHKHGHNHNVHMYTGSNLNTGTNTETRQIYTQIQNNTGAIIKTDAETSPNTYTNTNTNTSANI